MKISAVICTHNGEKVLGKAIQSLIGQSMDKKEYEILIIDNASTDNTREIISQFENAENLRYIFEPKLGLSNARNTGWQEAQGEIVAYLDDDAIACPHWLERIVEAFKKIPKAGAVGGKVEPIWEVEPPDWVNDFMQRFLSVLDWSKTPLVLDDNKYLVGANIAFPKRTLEKFAGFPADLGRTGKSLISNEEIELINMIKSNGQIAFYHPEIYVKHLIPASRLNSKWFIKRWFTQGVSNAILYCRANRPSKEEKRAYLINLLKNILKSPQNLFFSFFPSIFPGSSSRAHKSMVELGFIYGLIKEKV